MRIDKNLQKRINFRVTSNALHVIILHFERVFVKTKKRDLCLLYLKN